jgi:hypothetical protein
MSARVTKSGWSRKVKLAVAAGTAVAVGGAGVALGAGFEPAPERAPWTKRCGVQIRAYEDGSASLFCDQRRTPFAAVDGETGRVRFFLPR